MYFQILVYANKWNHFRSSTIWILIKGNKKDNSSNECRAEKGIQQTCQYVQTCDFAVHKGENCDVIASRVVALVIPIVILLLTTAIFSIYCFKKKADRAEERSKEINDRLPQIGVQDSLGYRNSSILYISQKSRSFDDGSETNNNFQGDCGYQWGGTNCTAGVTNFEKFTGQESDYESSLNSGHEPDLGSCSVSE